MVKLNLGCGVYYKPGYTNLDRYEPIADELVDIAHLPYEDSSIEEIEASHILEHFDVITLPFLLAEWYRVLIPGGVLHIETPHFRKQALKVLFTQHNSVRSRSAMRFLFGVDLPGNSHKVGLTPSYLKTQLETIGFRHITSHKSHSFKREHSFRLSVQKPMTSSLLTCTVFITTFRAAIFHQFKDFDVLFLDAVEKNVLSLIRTLFTHDNREFFSTPCLVSTAAKCALVHPQLARLFLHMVPPVRIRNLHLEILDYLETHTSSEKFLAVWMHWKKDPRNFFASFSQFQEYWGQKLARFLQNGIQSPDSLHYFEQIVGEPCKYFTLQTIELHALKLTNRGIKAFDQAQNAEAVILFKKATQLNPSCALCYWNLARLTLVLNEKKSKFEAKKWYHKALLHLNGRKYSRMIKNELKMVSSSLPSQFKQSPIQIRD